MFGNNLTAIQPLGRKPGNRTRRTRVSSGARSLHIRSWLAARKPGSVLYIARLASRGDWGLDVESERESRSKLRGEKISFDKALGRFTAAHAAADSKVARDRIWSERELYNFNQLPGQFNNWSSRGLHMSHGSARFNLRPPKDFVKYVTGKSTTRLRRSATYP